MTGSHVVVARYDMLAEDVLDSGCIFVGDDVQGMRPRHVAEPRQPPRARPRPRAMTAATTPTRPTRPSRRARRSGSAVPDVSIPPWDGKERLNILLIGADQRPGDGTFNTDTLIVVSIDPLTKQVAMFSLPRDTVDVPIPPGPPAASSGRLRGQDQRLVGRRPQALRLVPGQGQPRGYNGLKAILGNLYGLDIKYFVEVNFDGFKKIVDVIGGVTINVQVPVSDDHFPRSTAGSGASTSRAGSST